MTDINVVMLVKGEDRYIFNFDDDVKNVGATLRQLLAFASNPDLSFTLQDAAKVSQMIRSKTQCQ